MQKIGIYILLLVIGAIIGLSMGIYVSLNQPASTGEQVKVTIHGIEYAISEHSVLKIELVNNVPEKNLIGNITVYQDEKHWTNEVTWYYTGYGEAEVICDSINETQNFRVTYIENYPKATYLDRIIEWNEVTLPPLNFMDTEPVTITSVQFTGTSSNTINVTMINTGTTNVLINAATVTGYGAGSAVVDNSPPITIANDGASHQINMTLTGTWSAGNLYTIELISSKGNKYTYTETA